MAKIITMDVIYEGGQGRDRKEGIMFEHIVRWWGADAYTSYVMLSTGLVLCVKHPFDVLTKALDCARLGMTPSEYRIAAEQGV